jgi:hypothetical protein
MLCATRDVRAEVAGAHIVSSGVAGKCNTVISGAMRGLTPAILLSIFAINFMDRQILAILVEPIKHDLKSSDTQVGVLYGPAFAVLYQRLAV